MKRLRNGVQFILCISTLVFSLSSHAAVKYKTVEVDATKDGVVIGKKVIVTCRFAEQTREIMREKGSRKWCDTTLTDVCAYKKDDLAEKVCNARYRRRINQQAEIQESDEVVKLKAELIEIEQKRLDIADRVLELKRRELKLQEGS